MLRWAKNYKNQLYEVIKMSKNSEIIRTFGDELTRKTLEQRLHVLGYRPAENAEFRSPDWELYIHSRLGEVEYFAIRTDFTRLDTSDKSEYNDMFAYGKLPAAGQRSIDMMKSAMNRKKKEQDAGSYNLYMPNSFLSLLGVGYMGAFIGGMFTYLSPLILHTDTFEYVPLGALAGAIITTVLWHSNFPDIKKIYNAKFGGDKENARFYRNKLHDARFETSGNALYMLTEASMKSIT